MTTLDLRQLITQAEEAGADFKKVHVPAGPYRVEVTHARYNESKAGNPGYSVRTVIKEGAYSGKGFWTNFYLTPTTKKGEPNNAGIAIFFRNLEALGIDSEEFKTGQTTVEQVIQSKRLIGAVADAEVEDHEYNKEVSSRVKNFKRVSAAGGVPSAPSVVPPPPVVPAPPVAAGEPF